MSSLNATSSQATLMCNKRNCPALWQQEVEIEGQDFRFCQHHFNELEPVFVMMLDEDKILIDA